MRRIRNNNIRFGQLLHHTPSGCFHHPLPLLALDRRITSGKMEDYDEADETKVQQDESCQWD